MSGIRSESVNYIGYYSAHEETMKAVIAEQAIAGEERVAGVVRGATVDCRWEGIICLPLTINYVALAFSCAFES